MTAISGEWASVTSTLEEYFTTIPLLCTFARRQANAGQPTPSTLSSPPSWWPVVCRSAANELTARESHINVDRASTLCWAYKERTRSLRCECRRMPKHGTMLGFDMSKAFNNSGQILVCNGPSSYATPGPLIPVSVPKDPNSCHMEVLLVSEGTSSLAKQELEQAWMTGCTWSAQVMYLHWPSTQQCLVLRTLFMHLTGTADHDDGSASQWHSSCLYAT